MTTWTKIPKIQSGQLILEDMDGAGLEFMDGDDFYDMGGVGWNKIEKSSTTWNKIEKSSTTWNKIEKE